LLLIFVKDALPSLFFYTSVSQHLPIDQVQALHPNHLDKWVKYRCWAQLQTTETNSRVGSWTVCFLKAPQMIFVNAMVCVLKVQCLLEQ